MKLRHTSALPRFMLSVGVWLVLALGPCFGLAQQIDNCDRSCLEKRLSEAPNDPDILMRYGILLGVTGDYPNALRALEKGLLAAPNSIDLHIARARVLGYAARIKEGLQEIEGVIQAAPGYAEAYATRGRLHYYAREIDKAETSFNRALALNPLNVSARDGLKDVQSARASQDIGTWRLDLGYARSSLTQSTTGTWHEKTVRLEHGLENSLFWHFQLHKARRFNQIDQEYEFGMRAKIKPTLDTYLDVGTTPGANFLPRHYFGAGGSWQTSEGDPESLLGTTTLHLDTRARQYARTSTVGLNPGLTQYALGGRTWIKAVWLNSLDKATGKRLTGWMARTDVQYNDQFRIFVGYADAPEIDDDVKVGVVSRFFGATIQLMENLDATMVMSQERRKNSYRRNELAVFLGFNF